MYDFLTFTIAISQTMHWLKKQSHSKQAAHSFGFISYPYGC